MYQLNGIDLWHERSRGLLREAESGRIARRLRARRSKGAPQATSGRQSSPLRRAAAMWGRTIVPFFRA